jgi:uncharacterized glyoxalase superfamily protein PhnB
LVTA